MNFIINLVVILILILTITIINTLIARKKVVNLSVKREKLERKKVGKKSQIEAWKAKLIDQNINVFEEEDLKALKIIIKEIRSMVGVRKKELAKTKEMKTDDTLKNLEKNLAENENLFAENEKIFKDDWVSSLEIEEFEMEIAKIDNQIAGIKKTVTLWLRWLLSTAVVASVAYLASTLIINLIGGDLLKKNEIISSFLIWIIFFISQVFALINGYKEVPEKHEYVIVFFGEYFTTWESGLHFLFPFWMKIKSRVYMGDQSMVLNFTKEEGTTTGAKMDFIDASTEVAATIFFRIFSSKRAVFQPGDLKKFVSDKMESGVRAYYGRMTLDQSIEGRADVDLRQIVIQDATEAGLFKSWGVKITSLAVTDIRLPKEVDDIRREKLIAEKAREIAEITLKTEKINVNISEVKGSAEGKRLVKMAELLKLPLEQIVEYDKYIRHQEALGKAGVLIANSGEKNSDPASVGAVAGTVATVAQQQP